MNNAAYVYKVRQFFTDIKYLKIDCYILLLLGHNSESFPFKAV